MKKNDFIFLASVFIYSYLFWQQMPGLNFFLFTGILLFAQLLMNKQIIKNRNWILAAAGSLCSSFCVMYYGNTLGILACLFSLLAVSYFAYIKKGSILIGICSSLLAIGASIAYMVAGAVERRMNRLETPSGNKSGKRFLIVLIALGIVVVFFFMYRESSVMFYNLTEKINLDFISLPWIFFTCIGAIVLFGFYFHNAIPGFSEWDEKQPMKLSPGRKETWMDKLMSMDSEQFSGVVLFSLLNILLLVVNGLDAAFIFGGSGKLPDGITYTQYVHQGVGMLITSIVVAILIILFYFRGRMNFSANGKWLRNLAVLWIVQNAFMLLSTFYRNDLYCMLFGLTYKRIGVFVYLLLTLIGLIVTAGKVYGKRTNAFLIRANSWLFCGVWIIACFVNWDKMIFDYNSKIPSTSDITYLDSLSDDILPQLLQYSKTHPESSSTGQANELPKRAFVFLSKQEWLRDEMKWPSYQFTAAQNYETLRNENDLGTDSAMTVSNQELKRIYYFPGFQKLQSLDLSSNDLADVDEIGKYSNLTTLDLSRNENLTSISGIEKIQTLENLYLYGTKITDYSPLLELKNLKIIGINEIPNEWVIKLHNTNPKLEFRNEY